MKAATVAQMQGWDRLVSAQGPALSVLQGSAFASIKASAGWQPLHYLADNQLPILALSRPILGLGNLTYLPGGPMVANLEELAKLLPELRQLPGFVIQMEPELAASPQELEAFIGEHNLLLRPGVQPNRTTVVVDLQPAEADILTSFHSKTRYNVRLAERKGVKVEATTLTPEAMRDMYKLMHSSQERGGYYLRPFTYFKQAWEAFGARGEGQLFFAKYDGAILAGAFITYIGQKALYKDGGSTREHREAQPMSLLQWEVMRWLKGHGVTSYDLDGVPPSSHMDDPNHPFAGLARFKMGFSARVVEHIGMVELVQRTPSYRLWRRGGERLFGSALYRLRRQSIY